MRFTGNTAGVWGDYACDLPVPTYKSMLQYISKNFPEISYAIFTGDIPPHDVWSETRNSSITNDLMEMELFRQYLPHIPLFPSVGNHEAVPVNEFATRDIKGQWDMSWLYTPLAEAWDNWLPADAVESAKFAGYYTALTPDGTRIVSLNTNLGCNSENWWLTMPSNETADPDNQLHWFAKVMQAAEDNNETVYIISHIEIGDNCDNAWWINYFKIIVRYQNNIIASFAGHTHADIIHTTYVQDSTNEKGYRPLLSTYFAGSVTPFFPGNPGFRIYEIDAKTKALINYRQFYLNLEEANKKNMPIWKEEYSAQTAYEMVDLSPQEWQLMAHKCGANKTMLEEYTVRCGKGVGGCHWDAGCLQDALCDMYVKPAIYDPKTWNCGF